MHARVVKGRVLKLIQLPLSLSPKREQRAAVPPLREAGGCVLLGGRKREEKMQEKVEGTRKEERERGVDV